MNAPERHPRPASDTQASPAAPGLFARGQDAATRVADAVKTSKYRKAIIGTAVLVVLALGWKLANWIYGMTVTPPVNAVPVLAGKARIQDVPLMLESIGTVRAYNTVTVRPQVDGQLVKVAFQEGQTVKADDVLAQIDPRQFEAAAESARADLAGSQAALANAKRDLARYEDLAAKGFATRQQLDTQRSNVQTLQATVQGNLAKVHKAEIELGYTTITAPIEGRTGIRRVDVGNQVHTTDANGLVLLTQMQPISVLFTLPQNELSKLGGQETAPLKVMVFDSAGDKKLDEGTLELIDNTVDTSTGTIRLKAKLPNAQQTLWPGAFVKARLEYDHVAGGVTIPTRAISRGPKGLYVYVVKDDSTAEIRPVTPGQQIGADTLITQGLQAGETVVVDGQLRLAPGMKVRIQAPEQPASPAGAQSTITGAK